MEKLRVETPRQGLKILRQLTPNSQEVISLYYFQEKNQPQIAKELGVTQPSVSYRLSRARKQIRYFYELSVLRLPEDLQGMGFSDVEIEMLVEFYRTSCQSDAARVAGRSQGYARHQIGLAIVRLTEMGHVKVASTLEFVFKNPNISKELSRVGQAYPEEVDFPTVRVVEVLNRILTVQD